MIEDYKAAILTGREEIKLTNLPRPEPSLYEVLVRIHRVNLCPTDLKKYYQLDQNSVELLGSGHQIILGHEAAGVIAEIGSGVSRVQPGSRVAIDPMLPCGQCSYCANGDFPLCINLVGIGASAGTIDGSIRLLSENGIGGCFAEYVKVPEQNVFLIPDNLSFRSASLMEPLADVLHSLEVGAPQSNEIAAVFGLGAMGLMHIRVMADRGVQEIVAIDPIEERRKKAIKFGATQVFDPNEKDTVKFLKSLGDQTGPHVIFLCTGGEAQKLTTQQALQSIRKKGRILLYASAIKPAEIPIDINHIHYGIITFTGTVGFYKKHGELALKMLEEGIIDVNTIRTPSFPLEKIEEAFASYGRPDVVKVGIDIT